MSQPKPTASRIKPLYDGNGVIRDAAKVLPTAELKLAFLDALAELEENECHRMKTYPRTRLHLVSVGNLRFLRGYIDKISGWRLHARFGAGGGLLLIDVIPGQKHDDVVQVVLAKKERYEQ